MGQVDMVEIFLKPQKELLRSLTGEKQWDQRDSFWHELLSFPDWLISFSPKSLEDALLPFCKRLVEHNGKTSNFQVLLQHMILQVQDVNSSESARTASNTVVLVTVFLKYLIESLNADDLMGFLDAPQRMLAQRGQFTRKEDSWVNQIVSAINLVLTTIHVGNTTYLLHLAAMNLLLVVLSTQLYTSASSMSSGNHPFLEVMMDNRQLSQRLASVLLRHYSEYRPLPADAKLYQPKQEEDKAGVFRFVRTAAVSILWFPVQAITFLTRSRPAAASLSPLAETSLLLLQVLLHQADVPGHDSPFCIAIQMLMDNGEQPIRSGSESPPSVGRRDQRISFEQLYASLGAHMDSEVAVLLLYDLLHRNGSFRGFVVAHRDPDVLLLPLARLLYTSQDLHSSQMYLLLVVVLLLTQNAELSRQMHQVRLPSVSWYKERLLKDISLGSLFMILLLRIAGRSLIKANEAALAMNAIAAVCNLATHMERIDSYAASRLVKLIDALNRRYLRLASSGREGLDEPQAEALQEETQYCYDLSRLLLEMLSFSIVGNLKSNPELVYTMLHRHEVFDNPEMTTSFGDLLDNPRTVIQYFNQEADSAQEKTSGVWNVSNLLALIKEKLMLWPGPHQLRHFKELRFSYEEEASPADFFVPYVWTLVVTHTKRTIAWRQESIVLFSPHLATTDNSTLEDLEGQTSTSTRPSVNGDLNNV